MPDFLARTTEAFTNVSPGFVETLIQSRRAELFTGLMKLRYPSNATLVMTFLGGVQQQLYRSLELGSEVIPRQSWMDALNHADASVCFMPMTLEGMRLMKVAHEAPFLESSSHTLALPELIEQVSNWSRRQESAVVQIRTEQMNRLYLLSGVFNPVIEGISFVDGASTFSLNDASFPSLFQPADYQVTHFVSDRQHAAWQDYELRHAFNPLIRLTLNRFSELAGRMLTERLCERMSGWLKDEGWDIKVTTNGVSNHQYFESIESAAAVYWGLVCRFHDEASPAIGLRMAESLSHEILLKLDTHRREIVTRYIFNENHVDTVTGRVWR